MPPDPTIPTERARAAAQALVALENEAGISAQADRARDVWVGDPFSDVPLQSAASLAEGRMERRIEHESAGRRLRTVYFGVADPEMRKRLIKAHREVDAARHLEAAEAVVASRRVVWGAVRNGGARPVPEMIGAAVSAGSTWAAWIWAGPALAMALIVFFASTLPGATLGLIARRDAEIRSAEDELRAAEDSAEEAYSHGHSFTRNEERTGEPDPRP